MTCPYCSPGLSIVRALLFALAIGCVFMATIAVIDRVQGNHDPKQVTVHHYQSDGGTDEYHRYTYDPALHAVQRDCFLRGPAVDRTRHLRTRPVLLGQVPQYASR